MSGRNDDAVWLAFMLKDKYASNFEKDRLKRCVCSKFKRSDREICYVPFERNSGLSYYFFVLEREETDLSSIYSYRTDVFETFNRHKRITGGELNEMLRTANNCQRGYAKQGDLVTVKNGIYRKLHGIVLRQDRSPNKVVVGLKFCFGTVVETFDLLDLEVCGNLFNYLKVLK